jgi:Zn-dependent M16 (insulinase) family peptidase
MQGRENSGESLCHLSMLRSLYPNCGYSSETGGIMKNLRESTDNIKVFVEAWENLTCYIINFHRQVKNYHKEFYRPENLTMIISGKVKAEQVFSALADMENKICSKVVALI